MHERFLGKKVDITLPDHNGHICVDLVKNYVTTLPPLKPLLLVLKQVIFFAKLNDPYSVL